MAAHSKPNVTSLSRHVGPRCARPERRQRSRRRLGALPSTRSMSQLTSLRVTDAHQKFFLFLNDAWGSLSVARTSFERITEPVLRSVLSGPPSPLQQLRLTRSSDSLCEYSRYGAQLVELLALLEELPVALRHLERLILPEEFGLCNDCMHDWWGREGRRCGSEVHPARYQDRARG